MRAALGLGMKSLISRLTKLGDRVRSYEFPRRMHVARSKVFGEGGGVSLRSPKICPHEGARLTRGNRLACEGES